MRSSSNTSSAGARRGIIVRILRPTRLTAEQFEITRTRHSFSRSLIKTPRRHPTAFRRGIDGDGHVGFRCRHQVYRDAVVAECAKRLGQKAHLMPHADAVHRDQRQPVADADPFTWGSTSSVTDEMTVPAISGAVVLRMNSGISHSRTGVIQRGCSTALPADASSCASS